MRAVHTFVTEVLGELEHLFHAAHDAALEVEFRSHAQVERHVAGVVVRGERTGVRAAVNRLERRGLDLDKALLDQVFTDCLHNLETLDEDFLHVVVQRHVDVTLAVTGIHVGKFVEHDLVAVLVDLFLGDRERAHGLGEHRHLLHMHGVFARLRLEHEAVHADEVTEVGHLDDFVVFLAHLVAGANHLEAAIAVLQVHEAHFSLAVEADHTACKSDFFARRHQGFLVFLERLGIVRAVELVRIGLDAHFLELRKLRQTSLHLVIHVLHCHVYLIL